MQQSPRLALKVLKHESSQRKIDLDRFEREAKLLYKLKHPSIVEMNTLGQMGRTYYIEMEFIEGNSLKSYLENEPRPPLEQVLRWFKQILEAVQYIHTQGVIHRDLKPSNIMISGDQVKLVDFGIAKLATSDLTKTGTASILGTELFMAPEQWDNEATHLSDLYACGLLLGTLLGKPPKAPNRPSKLSNLDNISKELQSIYAKATSLEEAERFQSALDFLNAVSVQLLEECESVRHKNVSHSLQSNKNDSRFLETVDSRQVQMEANENIQHVTHRFQSFKHLRGWSRVFIYLLSLSTKKKIAAILFGSVVLFCFSLVLYKLGSDPILNHTDNGDEINIKNVVKESCKDCRGPILDYHGQILAHSIRSYDIILDDKSMDNQAIKEVKRALSQGSDSLRSSRRDLNCHHRVMALTALSKSLRLK
jgi:serine/threonine protein kinase